MNTLILVSNLIEAFVWIAGGIIVLLIRSEFTDAGNRSYKISKRWLATSFVASGFLICKSLIVSVFCDEEIEFLSLYSLLFFYLGVTAMLLSFVTLHNWKNLSQRDLLLLFGPTLVLILLHGVAVFIWGSERVYSFDEYLATVSSSPALLLRTVILLTVFGGICGAIYKYFKARKAYTEMINNYFSGAEQIRRSRWMDHCCFFLFGMLSLTIVSSLITSEYFELFYGMLLSCGMIYLIVQFINYQTIFRQIIPAIEYTDQAMTAPRERPDSAVGVLLQHWMARDDKPYLQGDLSLEIVSRMVGIGNRKLSAHLNIKYGMTFNSWINMLRIQEVERILKNRKYDNKTLSEIADYAGFADPAAMNNAFKKIMGVSPSAFRKSEKR